VINLGVAAVVPELCWLLSELGAEVIKIESRANLDVFRRVTFEPDAPNRSWMFNDSSRGQKSVCLDLRTARGHELALRLCATADVVAENCRGGVTRSLRLDYEDVRRVKPDVIYLSSQGYGRGGPLGEVPSFGPLNSAFAGATWLWNHPQGPRPGGSSLNHPDHIASKLAAVAVLAALERRRRTGEGQFIDMSQSEATAYLMGEFYLEGTATGREARQAGNAVDYACPHGVYPCAGVDRWCAIAVVGDGAWQRFRARVGWPDETRLATLQGRLAARAALDSRVADWTRSRSPEEASTILQEARVSAMTVQNGDDHRDDPHLARRRALVSVKHYELGWIKHSGNPIRMRQTRVARPAPAPLLGEHTEGVLTRVLGLSKQEVRGLVAAGVCR
jgi:benzylsuccinate CoA-transferase BbsF subunit